jgi:hypothetical protein
LSIAPRPDPQQSLQSPGQESDQKDQEEEPQMIQKLESGDTLPEIQLQLVGGGTLTLPTDMDSDFGVALFYRGFW